jgi:octaprenyl-diphosphate synthase
VRPDEEIEAAAEYGRSLGTAFQLIDDVLDYSGNADDIGKNVGDDLREGKADATAYLTLMQYTARPRSGSWFVPA